MRKQPGQPVAAQVALVPGHRVEKGHVAVPGGTQRRGLRLADPVRRQQRTQPVLELEEGVVRDRAGPGSGHDFREGVVSVGPRHLLDQVHLAQGVVAAVPRHHDLQGVGAPLRHLVPERGEQTRELVRGEVDAQDVAHPGRPERHERSLPGHRASVDYLAVQRPAGSRQDEGRRPEHRGLHRRRVNAALEAVARVGGHAQCTPRGPYLPGLEERALEQNVRRIFRDFGVPPSHHAGNRHGALCVTDHEHVGCDRASLAVQRHQGLPGTCAADHDRGIRQAVQVEGVERLTQLQHDVVGGVHDAVDGAGSRGPQPIREPPGRRPDGNAPDHGPQVA